jgi:hypothetical protein
MNGSNNIKILTHFEFIENFISTYNDDKGDLITDLEIITNMLYHSEYVQVSSLLPMAYGPNVSFVGTFQKQVLPKYWKITSEDGLNCSGFISPNDLVYLKIDDSIVARDVGGALVRLVPFILNQ